ncbi:MAG: hypothetical protein DI629_03150 [Mesorhizobium amorphae]|nr:MAG: hypothetical protein DI629_03150 [Mesorhizobium amorphae]
MAFPKLSLPFARRGNPYYRGPKSENFDGTFFFNRPDEPPHRTLDILAWMLGGGRTKWPKEAPSPFPQAKPTESVAGCRITMVGHSSTLLQVAGLNILTDPVWSERASPFSFTGPKRVNAPGIRFEDLPPIDAVLVSHNHYDHMDVDTLERLHAAHDPLVVTPLGNDTILRERVPGMRVEALDWGRSVSLGPYRARLVPVHHWSARWTRDRRMALWGGFVLEAPGGAVFFAGDTGFDEGKPYRSLAETSPPIRLALLPIGAYEPRWFMKAQHQNPEEAVEGFRLSGAAFAAGIHWGTFQLTNEGLEEPASALSQALEAAGIAQERFRPLRPGEVWDVPPIDKQ